MREKLANAANSVLAADITSGATSLTVNDASRFPTSGQFRLLIDNEYLRVTGVSGNVFTVARSQEGSTAASHLTGATVVQCLTLGGLTQFCRDNTPLFDGSRPAFKLLDSSANPLTSADFSALNTGAATITDHADGSLSLLTTPGGTTGLSFVGLARPLSTGKQLTAAIRPALQQGGTAAWTAAGIAWYDSVSGKAKLLCVQNYNSTFHLTIRQFDTFTSGGTAPFDSALWLPGSDGVWLRLYSDGTTLHYYVSSTGDDSDMIEVYNESVGTYLTPDHFALAINNKGSLPIVCRLCAWAEV